MSVTNDLTQQLDIFFDQVIVAFDATNETAKSVSLYKPNAGQLAESGQTFYRPWQMLTEVVDGRDVTGQFKDLTELTVPSTLTDAHIRNCPVSFTGKDLNNPHIMKQTVMATTIMLNNKVDTLVANKIVDQGTLVVTNSGAFNTYDELAIPDALMLENQVTKGMRHMLLNPRMSVNVTADLVQRERNSEDGAYYERAALRPVGGFDTRRVDYAKTLTGSTGSGYLVNGADQDYTPIALDGNDLPVDNRTQTLAVDTGSNAAVGDCFTIAGVNAVGSVNKQDTGQLKTFRIDAINGGNWTIAPAIIPADGSDQSQKDYANVATTPADNAAITILNTKTAMASSFYEKDAIEIIHGDYNVSSFRSNGKNVRMATTDSGLTIIMLSDSNIETLATKYRFFIWCNPEVLNREAVGIMLPNQT